VTFSDSASSPKLQIILGTFLWALLGAVCATLTWATLNGLLAVTRGADITWFITGFVAGLYFGAFVALLFLVPYWCLLLLYAALLSRRRLDERKTAQFLLVAFSLALPVALIVFISFLDPWSPLGPFWDTAPIAGPMALVSAWAGIVAPRLLIPSLRPGSWPVAA